MNERDLVVPGLLPDALERFRSWLLQSHYKILPPRGSWEILKFTNGVVTCSFERRAKRNSWISFNGAADVLEFYRKEQKDMRVNHPAVQNLKPQKFCKDCIYHAWDQDEAKIKHFCKAKALLNLVTGQPTDAMSNRKNESLCGQSARYFSPKAK